MTDNAQFRVEWEISMLIHNALKRRKQNGYYISLQYLINELDGRQDIARKVLLVNGFIPNQEDGDLWSSACGAGQYRPLQEVLSTEALVDVLNVYDPV
ncbi:hypothetical protein ACFSUD_17215 [Sulfitobacter aestuarii]|uniref:Uncharacterized protein n=1 Tax=Sulfitobacter aestuarii TaxID=2161676 RepID=A0ABW5U613_9RHOB